jgi:hypothetical protein
MQSSRGVEPLPVEVEDGQANILRSVGWGGSMRDADAIISQQGKHRSQKGMIGKVIIE